MPSQVTVSYLAAHPLEAARILERKQPQQLAAFLRAIDPETAAGVLAPLTPVAAAACVQQLDPTAGLAIVEHLPIHASSALLRSLGRNAREALLDALPPLLAGRLRRVLSYADDSAGAWAEPDALAVDEELTVGAVIERARRAPDSLRKYVYVLNSEHRLVGVVDARRCFLAPRATRVGALADKQPICVPARASLAEVAELPAWQRFDVLPVIDRSNTYVGALRRSRLSQALETTTASAAPARLGETAAELADLYFDAAASVLSGGRQ